MTREADASGPLAGVVLAGGKSSRMGEDKAQLVWQGETLLDRARQCLRTAGWDDVLVSGRPEEADGVLEHYLEALRTIAERGLEAEISVKPTQLGIDFGTDVAEERIRRLVGATPTTVWIDMEASEYVDATLDIFTSLRRDGADVGLCIQSYLRRTRTDLEKLLELDPSIR